MMKQQVVHCDTIYDFFAIFDRSYIQCSKRGKGYRDPCNKDNEYSSKSCTYGSCSSYVVTPSDSDNTKEYVDFLISFSYIR